MNPDLETAKTLALVALILTVIGFALALLTIFLAFLPLLFILLDYFLVYAPLTRGDAKSAETPSLVLGIIQLFPFGGVIPGILLIIAYVKIRDARNKPVTVG